MSPDVVKLQLIFLLLFFSSSGGRLHEENEEDDRVAESWARLVMPRNTNNAKRTQSCLSSGSRQIKRRP
ncbi:hypothetical protein ABFA07_012697 [Porites harrisoni]